jgi:AcrR family transcriptional regulator
LTRNQPLTSSSLRADAARNVERIVRAGARLLADDPGVGMSEVALAAGVGRATLYRHFATREVLLQSIWQHVVADWEVATHDARLDEGPAVETLTRLARAWLEVSHRYSLSQLLQQTDFAVAPRRRREQRRVFAEPVLALIRRGQASGELSGAVSPEWVLQVFQAIVQAGARSVAAGDLARDDAPDLVVATLLRGLAAG